MTNDPADGFWRDRVVMITGASSGIGLAVARHLASRGARLGLVARRRQILDQVVAELTAQGGVAVAAPADVVDGTGLNVAARELAETLGDCQALIASAGVYRKTAGASFNAEAANQVIAVNLTGVINAIGAVLPGMVERGAGNIAAIGSLGALLGLPAASAYCASKAGVVRLLDGLRVDLGPRGVHVTTICPGYVDTPMITDEERETLNRVVSAEDAARRICHDVARGRAESWFPRTDYVLARLARLLPTGLYLRAMRGLEEMEETN